MTDAERLLWQHLRAGRLCGYKFRRQQPIGRYIVDFICFERKLMIELDGGQHQSETAQYDIERDAWIKSQGFEVLRLWNNEFLQNQVGALEKILALLENPPLPNPSPTRGEGANNTNTAANPSNTI
jgi:very-short-patch-repair endonuclease